MAMDRLHILPAKSKEIFGDELWHGALYGIETTGSGAERVRLLKSDPVGRHLPNQAVIRINDIFKDSAEVTKYIPAPPKKTPLRKKR